MRPAMSYAFSVAAAAVALFAAFNWPVPLVFSLTLFYVFQIALALTSIFVVTIGPFLLVRRFRRSWLVTDLALYPAVGLGLGLFGAALLAVAVNATGIRGDPDTLSISEGLRRFIPNFAFAGLTGGVAYWGATLWRIGAPDAGRGAGRTVKNPRVRQGPPTKEKRT